MIMMTKTITIIMTMAAMIMAPAAKISTTT